jgi:tRNA (guanine37-N1)-methyltransferase
VPKEIAMRFDVITLFPDLFGPALAQGVTRRAFDSGAVEVHLWPLRDHADDAYRRVDDRPFGGGPGMVMLAEPLQRALAAVRAARVASNPADPPAPRVPLVHFTPTGRRLTQAVVAEFAAGPGAILLCGRYEGIDQRFIARHVDAELSLGDFVLSGGELPALVLLDAVARLMPGVLTEASHQQDSFSNGLLDCPHYSRPERLVSGNGNSSEGQSGDGDAVPAVLMSGHHGHIARWRREQSLGLTARRRPDLIAAARADGRLDAQDERFLSSLDL